MDATETQTQSRHPSDDKPWLFKPGQSGNPAGRPKSMETMKEYARKWYMNLTDEQKTAYILAVEEKRPGFAWTMAEGNPDESKRVSISVPQPILGAASQPVALENATQDAIEDAAIEAVVEEAHD